MRNTMAENLVGKRAAKSEVKLKPVLSDVKRRANDMSFDHYDQRRFT